MSMDKKDKVIKALECCLKESDHLYSNPCKDCPYEGKECIDRMKADALALLKEQEAVEPIIEYNLFLCPVCKNTLFIREQKFCHECGKRIEWKGR